MFEKISSRMAIFVVVAMVCLLLFIQIPGLTAGASEPPDVDNEMRINVTESGNLTLWMRLDISRDYYRQPVFLSLESLDVQETDCLNEADFGKATHRVDGSCEEITFTASRNITEDIGNGDSIGYVQQRNFLVEQELRILWGLSVMDNEVEGESLYGNAEISTSGHYFSSNNSDYVGKKGFLYGGTAAIKHAKHESDTVQVVGAEPDSEVAKIAHGIDEHAVVPEDGKNDNLTLFIFPDEDSKDLQTHNFPGDGFLGIYYHGGPSLLRHGAGVDVAIHEYVHAQEQSFKSSSRMKWIDEGQATYYSTLSYHNASHISELLLHSRLPSYGTDAGSVLTNQSDWATNAEYDKGQAVLAGLDSCIKRETQDKRLSDVFKQLYDLNQTVTMERFNQTVHEETGIDAMLWIEAYTTTEMSPEFEDGEAVTCPSTINNQVQNNSSVTVEEAIKDNRESKEEEKKSEQPPQTDGPLATPFEIK